MNVNCDRNYARAMTPDQFAQVVEAILDGKYSWACVLILKFAGYNPLHYIPYRTYNRLMKDNGPKRSQSLKPSASRPEVSIRDLNHIKVADSESPRVVGGYRHWIPVALWSSQ